MLRSLRYLCDMLIVPNCLKKIIAYLSTDMSIVYLKGNLMAKNLSSSMRKTEAGRLVADHQMRYF